MKYVLTNGCTPVAGAAHIILKVDDKQEDMVEDVATLELSGLVKAREQAKKGVPRVEISGKHYEIPLGLSLIISQSGQGKSTTIRKWATQIDESLIGESDHYDSLLLQMSEPDSFTPWDVATFYAALVAVELDEVLLIDSIMGVWTDSSILQGSAYGKSGASLAVPQFLSVVQRYLLTHGKRAVAVINPQLTDIGTISSALVGATSMFVNLSPPASVIYRQIKWDAPEEEWMCGVPTKREGGAVNNLSSSPKGLMSFIDEGL